MKIASEIADATSNLDRLSTIWAIIEAKEKAPSLLVVASASIVDDTEVVARGLARVVRDAGKRTGYLYLGPDRGVPTNISREYAELALPAAVSPRESLDSWLRSWRVTYDVVIVELPELPSCAFGAHVARIADGIVIALQSSRQVIKADRELKTLFSQLQASIIGVVTTSAAPSAVKVKPLQNRSFSSFFFPARQ